ncbi:phosphatidic acid phosphatase type 2/haloperoxidase [Halteromyces radiatus]|uniref:phosphatidic acid phosphatase type 2/haloperoxidase n=1 Tax=Halteromyces radiatus TaxID=101107 RepID=UPI0022211B43|nr:phosphatidic acid phosphatase type 2/haloperoxidase [Halteromyces radiatus]KAI8085185.1 phosphatidic acid phosphatase type 2/haloperoxidase [Halteromyces radiatus]
MIPDSWKRPQTRPIVFSYVIDWALVVVMAIIFFMIDRIQPFHREFSLNDPNLMHTYALEDSVPVWLLAVLCAVIPAVIIAFMATFIYKRALDLNHGLLGLFLSLALCAMITDTVKITVGRPRPDLIARCQPPADAHDPHFGLSNYTICTVDPSTPIMIDGFKSFPSGHTSFSFAGLTFFSLYLAGKLNLFDQKGEGRTLKIFIFWIPILGALLVGISRYRDYRHHWGDILIGGIVGLICAIFSYHQYYPPLSQGGNPYNGRILRHNQNNHFDEESQQIEEESQQHMPSYRHDDDNHDTNHPPSPTSIKVI